MKDVSFTIDDGDFVAFVGTNGAGKSTTMRLCNGLLKPDSGEVLIDGMPTTRLRTSELARRVGFLFQNPDRQICCGTVKEELLFGFTAQGGVTPEAEERVDAIIREFGFDPEAEPYLLNRGTRQLLALASIIVMEQMDYTAALPLYGLRQNIYTDPQKPMKVAPGIYPLNGADENSVCVTTVDFALTYFVVSGELERSGVPCNLLISDAGGMSVLTAWAAGKLSAGTIAKFIAEEGIEDKIKNRTLIIPGKVAILKGELDAKLPDWNVVVGTREAVQIVKFMKDYA